MLLFGKQDTRKILHCMVSRPYPERDVHRGELEGGLDELPKDVELPARACGS